MLNGATLTNRETEILTLIGEGLNTRRIAFRLKLSVRTVEAHKMNIRRKTGHRGRSNLAILAPQDVAGQIEATA